MDMIKSSAAVKRLAGLELNDLLLSKNLPASVFDDTRVSSAGTPVYDTNGSLLFRRVSLKRGRDEVGFADIAVNPALGAPFLSASSGQPWNEKALVEQGVRAVKGQFRRIVHDSVRFVAYSYPKLALQFLLKGEEIGMLELFTWKPVPPMKARETGVPPANFERWSLLDEMPARTVKANVDRFNRRILQWEEICPESKPPRRFKPEIVRLREFERLIDVQFVPRVIQRELHYSLENADHFPCYELRSQITNVWCVAASVQMLLLFYRYNYDQVRLATDLGLGTIAHPNGLPYSRVGDVVTVLENLSGNALNATMITNPNWSQFVAEIRANRPMVSFVPGHSRTVAGFTSGPGVLGNQFHGLLVYDPWPPSPSTPVTPMTGGVITRWENFDTTTYTHMYTAELVLH
jgi:hypothetical protein